MCSEKPCNGTEFPTNQKLALDLMDSIDRLICSADCIKSDEDEALPQR